MRRPTAQCHNDLILAVLHNVTAPPLPSSSSRSSGWLKKRKQSTTLEFSTSDQETKRRRLNDAVMALGKKERARLKGLVHQPTPSHLLLPSSSTSDHITKKPSAPLGTPKTVQGRSAAFQQDFARCRNTPLCAESLRLPDMESLQARMSWSAYQADLLGGADTEAVSVLMAALTVRSILRSVLSYSTHFSYERTGSFTRDHAIRSGNEECRFTYHHFTCSLFRSSCTHHSRSSRLV